MDDESSIIAQTITDEVREQLAQLQPSPKPPHPFRAAIFRGLAVLLPPLLTVVIFFWIGGTVNSYVIQPIFRGAKSSLILILTTADRPPKKVAQPRPETIERKGKTYRRAEDGTYVSQSVYEAVEKDAQENLTAVPPTGRAIYEHYVEITFLEPYVFIPVLTLLFLLILYLVGKFIAVSAGRIAWKTLERFVEQVPLVREVYGAVKKVIDFALAEHEVRFSRVVAIQWPRKGIWALALVTSEGMPAMEKLVGEPVFAVLVPTSPMPATGFTLHVKQSEAIDIGITIDQAIQFVVSCGVVAVSGNGNDSTTPKQSPPLAAEEKSGEKTKDNA